LFFFFAVIISIVINFVAIFAKYNFAICRPWLVVMHVCAFMRTPNNLIFNCMLSAFDWFLCVGGGWILDNWFLLSEACALRFAVNLLGLNN